MEYFCLFEEVVLLQNIHKMAKSKSLTLRLTFLESESV